MDGGAVRDADGPRLTRDGSSGGASPNPARPVLFFDGHCGLCNTFVDFVLARDRAVRFRFSPLQGETAARLVPDDAVRPVSADDPAPPRSVVLCEEGAVFRRSDAALRALAGLGGAWRAVHLLRAVPRPLRDAAYGFVARHRYRWFGRREVCRMPGPGERERFLP